MLVRHNFTTLQDSAQAQRVIELYPAVGDFLQCIGDTYINEEFPIPTWNVFNWVMELRTTNIVEGIKMSAGAGIFLNNIKYSKLMKPIQDWVYSTVDLL